MHTPINRLKQEGKWGNHPILIRVWGKIIEIIKLIKMVVNNKLSILAESKHISNMYNYLYHMLLYVVVEYFYISYSTLNMSNKFTYLVNLIFKIVSYHSEKYKKSFKYPKYTISIKNRENSKYLKISKSRNFINISFSQFFH